ncbi:helix-turn-helix domain-containing protein [Terrimonas sp. NA20]|uniref:Helix-turn-helix domain-containing protein n=1 Tax=Terrimonas ginsenosidimutans TaxID=2908004 RepID=A0ABS9KKI9_9BACT|nr:helix-turn-helix domain-containing protein [Terrimonas ginsenosidimutans]MCG2612832.1 helix-turn-helix domain-containing protein [Terrimonas ginsenosidimutans]
MLLQMSTTQLHDPVTGLMNQPRFSDAGISIQPVRASGTVNDNTEGFTLIVLSEGSGTINIDGGQISWEGTYACPLNDDCNYIIKESSFRSGYEIKLSKAFIQRNNLAIELLPFTRCNGFSLQSPAAEEIVYLVKKISLLQNFTNGQDESITATLIKLLLLYLHKSMPETNRAVTAKRQHALAGLFFNLVGKHFRARKMVTDYASELCISPHYLSQVVKEVTGETPSYFIQQQIAKEAKKQALMSSKSMKEVAYDLGFDDQAHFSKFFKKNTGMNFTTFRSTASFAL